MTTEQTSKTHITCPLAENEFSLLFLKNLIALEVVLVFGAMLGLYAPHSSMIDGRQPAKHDIWSLQADLLCSIGLDFGIKVTNHAVDLFRRKEQEPTHLNRVERSRNLPWIDFTTLRQRDKFVHPFQINAIAFPCMLTSGGVLQHTLR